MDQEMESDNYESAAGETILDENFLGVMNQRLLIRAPYAKTVDFIHVNLSGLSFSPKLEIHIKFILGNF